jgi:hypothetical protein
MDLNKLAVPLRVLQQTSQNRSFDRICDRELSAIHSGKLGDIIYSLPACKVLGIRHLVLNTFHREEEPLRTFTYAAAKQLTPLLLAQDYIEKVTITECDLPLEYSTHQLDGIDFNLDRFRQVPRHRAASCIRNIRPRFARFEDEDAPAHLAELFAATLGIQIDLSSHWLNAYPSPETRGSVVVSITQNWRSYPDIYWQRLLEGLDSVVFVGTASEWKHCARFVAGRFVPAADHLELASLIQAASLFLGTVSFPYSVAEGLKVPRALELCHRNLNAFPIGVGGFVLPPDVIRGRELVAAILGDRVSGQYQRQTRRMKLNPKVWYFRKQLSTSIRYLRANESRRTTILRKLVKLLHFLRSRHAA